MYNPGGDNYTEVNPGVGDMNVDPQLLASSYGEVHLKQGSPCINAGDDSVSRPDWFDMDGEARIQGTHIDIGGDEFNGMPPSYQPKIVRVTSTGNDLNDGSSWALAVRTVQAGIDIASSQGGEVWVAAGIYDERIVLKTWSYVLGGFVGNEISRHQRNWSANVTVLDGQADGTVVTSRSGYHSSSIDGFTIRNGNVQGLDRIGQGGGLYINSASPSVLNNAITGNFANYGAGIFCAGSSSIISKNSISTNSATSGGGIYLISSSPSISANMVFNNTAGYGAGIYCHSYHDSFPEIIDNSITGNIARSEGGGIYCYACNAYISGNDISANRVVYGGGGIYMTGASKPLISRNVINANNADPYGIGGGVYCYNSMPSLLNNVMVGNAARCGGGLSCSSFSGVTICNSTLVGNYASYGYGGGIYCYDGYVSANSCLIAFNSSGLYDLANKTKLHNCCVYNPDGENYTGITPGLGDISANPLFVRNVSSGPDGAWGTVDDDYGDLRLRPGSPCIDAGYNAGVPAGTSTDFHGLTRFVDDLFTLDCQWAPGSCGTGPIVDIGAYEFQAIAGDLDGNESIDPEDATNMTACGFGPAIPYTGQCVRVDFDADGDVDAEDFGELQRRYGE